MCARGCERVCPSLEGTVPAVALAVSAALVVSATSTSSMYYAQRVTALRIAHCSFEALL